MNHIKVMNQYVRSNKKNSKFKETLLDKFNIDMDEYYIIQGCCTVDDYILISAYHEDRHYKSMIYVIENNKIIHSCKLDTNAHVGGISYDKIHQNLWCTDKSGTISAYNIKDILNNDTAEAKFKRIFVGEGLVNVYGNEAVAYINVYNNKIYLGNFNNKNLSKIKIFDILDNGSIDKIKFKTIKGTAFTQGIYVDDKCIITSSSWGPFNKSKLNVYKYTDGEFINNEHRTYALPCMIEQICIHDNKLITAYESNAFVLTRIAGAKDIRIYTIDTLVG